MKRRGPKTKYNHEAILNDCLCITSNKDVAEKHGVTQKVVANIRYRYIKGNAVIVPPVEQALRKIEKGVEPEKIISKYGFDIYQEAQSFA
jgi:hypothetical protein